jgi:hypothetical protein
MSRMDIFGALPAIMVFYLLIFGNYIAELLPCRLQDFVGKSILARHIIGFFTLVFFVVLSEKSFTSGRLDISSILLRSFIVYLIFIISSRSNIMFWSIGTGLLLVYYVIDLYKKEHPNEKDRETGDILDTVLKVLGPLILTSYILGCIIYLGEKRYEFGDKFRIRKFILGRPYCRGKSPKLEPLLTRFMRGVYLK